MDGSLHRLRVGRLRLHPLDIYKRQKLWTVSDHEEDEKTSQKSVSMRPHRNSPNAFGKIADKAEGFESLGFPMLNRLVFEVTVQLNRLECCTCSFILHTTSGSSKVGRIKKALVCTNSYHGAVRADPKMNANIGITSEFLGL